MKIGFDISQIGNANAGCGFFAENLISHLANIDSVNQYLLYPTFGDHYWDDLPNKHFINKPNFNYGMRHSNFAEAKHFWANALSDFETHLGSVDILHANNFFCPPKLKHGKLVYTLYDLSFLEYPDCTTDHNRIACFDGVFRASLHADFIIAISHFSREHFLKIFPHFSQDKIAVIHPASRFEEVGTRHSLQTRKIAHLESEKFWLTVGTLEPRKNIKFLLEAYAKLKSRQPTLPLVLAGKQGWMTDNLEQMLRKLDIMDDVHVLGYVDNAELQWLYQHCLGLIYPSLFEGFGLPVLEAMSLGAPIITSNTSSLPEVVGQAGILINPLEQEELIQAMIRLAEDQPYRKILKDLALKQSKQFSWNNTAKKVLSLYEDILSHRSVS